MTFYAGFILQLVNMSETLKQAGQVCYGLPMNLIEGKDSQKYNEEHCLIFIYYKLSMLKVVVKDGLTILFKVSTSF